MGLGQRRICRSLRRKARGNGREQKGGKDDGNFFSAINTVLCSDQRRLQIGCYQVMIIALALRLHPRLASAHSGMGPQATMRALEREERRQQRAAIRRQKELERQAKEQAKLSALERAELEVSTFENQLDLLLSLHKEQGPAWDWQSVASCLLPPAPERLAQHELRARQQACFLAGANETTGETIAQAQSLDDQQYQQELAAHGAETARLEELKSLAHRILVGDLTAYTTALRQLSPLSELSVLGSTIHFTVHSTHLIECILNVAGPQIIPAETKSLTSAGKLSVKATPRARLHELYQDHICSCMLRVARESFALLPVDTLVVTARVESRGGRHSEEAVLSAVFPRGQLLKLEFDQLDPSDAIETFLHRGDFKASRKTAAFAPIVAFAAAEISGAPAKTAVPAELLAHARALGESLRAELASLSSPSTEPKSPPSQVQ